MSFAAAIVSRISSLSPSSQHLDSGDESESIISSQGMFKYIPSITPRPMAHPNTTLGSCSSSLSSNDSLPKSLESSTSTSSCDAPQSVPSSSKPLRANEHLAVLLPKHLWKVSCLSTMDRHARSCGASTTHFNTRSHSQHCALPVRAQPFPVLLLMISPTARFPSFLL